jgi:hypothetical protein
MRGSIGVWELIIYLIMLAVGIGLIVLITKLVKKKK